MNARDGRYKVSRVIEEYDLEGLGEELADRWASEGSNGASLRELADQFNREVLRSALQSAEQTPTDVEETYRRLTGDDVSSGTRTETRKRLERGGIDVDAVSSDFVSYQAIRTYLREGRGIEYPDREPTDVDESVRTIEQLKGRLTTVAEDRIQRLTDTDQLDVGAIRVITNVTTVCEDCGAQYDLVELLQRGGCECEREPEDR